MTSPLWSCISNYFTVWFTIGCNISDDISRSDEENAAAERWSKATLGSISNMRQPMCVHLDRLV